MRQGVSGDGDRQFIAHGEVGETEPPRRMRLSEEDLAFTAVLGAPLTHRALQRPQHCPIEALGITQLQFLQHGHRHQAGRRFQHRHDIG